MKVTHQKDKPKNVADMESSLELIESVDLKEDEIAVTNEFDSAFKLTVNEHQAAIESQASKVEEPIIAIECVKQGTVVKNNAIVVTAEVNKSSENQPEMGNIYEEIIIKTCEFASSSAENTQSIDHSKTGQIEGIEEHQVAKVAGTGEAEVSDESTSHSLLKFKNDASQMVGDFYSSEVLRRKGYNLNSYNNIRQLVNLHLIDTICKTNEIQCTNLPDHMRENQLIPLFEKYGNIYQLRMNLKDKKHNLSEAFVTYTIQSEAENAIKSLHRCEIQGRIISVTKYIQDLRVLIKPIPSSATENEVLKKFKYTEGLLKVTFNEKDNKNLGFCFLHYQSYEMARQAKRFLSNQSCFGRNITSAWPSRASRIDDKKLLGQDNVESSYSRLLTKMTDQQMPNEKNDASHTLYVTNLRSDIRSTDLRKIFSLYGEIGQIDKDDNFASVEFRNVEDCRRAAHEIDKKLLGEENVQISRSRLATKMSDQLVKQIPNEKNDVSHTLYVTNLRSDIRSTDSRKIFSLYGEIGQIDKDDNFASVEFRNVEDCRRAAHEIDKKLLGEENVQISRSRLATRLTDQLVKQIPNEKNDASHTLYVTNLRSDIRSTDLRKIFSLYGEIGQIDKDDNFASVEFRNVEDCRRAAHEIDKKLLGEENVQISRSRLATKMSDQLVKQIPNEKNDVSHTLYVTNLRSDIRSTDSRKIFSLYGEIGQIDKDDNFASVEFRNVEDCRRAAHEIDKKLLGEENVQISRSRLATKMSDQLVKLIPNEKNDVSHTLYVTNLRSDIRSTDLRKIFSVYGEIGQIDKDDNFASVEFRNVEDCRRAAHEIDKKLLGEENVQISRSRLATKMSDQLVKQIPNEKNDVSHTLYVTNLRSDIRSTDSRKIFSLYGEIGQIDKDDNFASVEFRNVEDCRRAAHEIDKKLLGEENVQISRSRLATKMSDQLVKLIPNEKNDVSHTLYVTNLRSDIRSTDLRKIFSVYGEIGQIDKDDNFASVEFRNVEDCRRAAHEIDKKLLGEENVQISRSRLATKMSDQLVKQIPNEKNDVSHTLYVTNLRSDIRSTDSRKIFSLYGEIGQIDKDDNFASVEFRNVEDCRRAAHEIDKKLLGEENVQISRSRLATKMSDQLVKLIPNEKNDVSHTLYVTNLRSDIRSTDLRKIFSVYGEIGQIDKDDNFASVEFRNVEDCRRAAHEIDKKLLGEENVQISRSRLATRLTDQLVKQIPNEKNDASHTLYVTNLRSDIRSTDLRKIFSLYGEIGQIDKDDNFASVEFRNVEDCRRAAHEIDKKLLGEENVQISRSRLATKMSDQLVKQIPNEKNDVSHTLYVTNLRSDIRSTDSRKIFSLYGEIGQIDKDDNFASVEFRNVEDCRRAAHEIDKKLLGEENVQISRSRLATKMSDQLVKLIPNEKNDVSHTLYVTNLRSDIRSTDLRKIFSVYGEIGQIDKDDNFASVEFRNVEDCRRAAHEIDKKLLGEENVQISRSRLATRLTDQLVKQIPNEKNDASHTLYVTNLRSDIRSTDLRKIFSLYGEIGQIDKDDNFASVEFRNVEDCRRASYEIDKKLLGKEDVKISHSRPPTNIDPIVTATPNVFNNVSHISGNVKISRSKQHIISPLVSPQKKIDSIKPYSRVVIKLDKTCIWNHLKL